MTTVTLTPSDTSWTAPSVAVTLSIECYAASGGTPDGTLFAGSNGSGGGGYSKKTITTTADFAYSCTISSGPAKGLNGGKCFFGTTAMEADAVCLANGGLAAMTGGTTTGAVGDTKNAGGNGGELTPTDGGGGGGCAGPGGAGNNGSNTTGGTGNGGIAGNGANAGGQNSNGVVGATAGGGSSGPGKSGVGAAGAPARIVLNYDELLSMFAAAIGVEKLNVTVLDGPSRVLAY